MNKLYHKYKDKDVVFIGLTNEDRNDAHIDEFIKDNNMDYIIGTGTEKALYSYKVKGIPRAYVIDKQGYPVWDGHPLNGLEKVIENLIGK
jgi:hypothetical protein